MPPIHRDKSLDEYYSGSNTTKLQSPQKKNGWSSASIINPLQLSPSNDGKHTKLVSEGSSNSNCSSSSSSDNTGDKTVSKSISKVMANSNTCSAKEDCVYAPPINNTSSSGCLRYSTNDVAHNDTQNRFHKSESRVNKNSFNNMKLQTKEIEMEHHVMKHEPSLFQRDQSHLYSMSDNIELGGT